MGLITKTDLLVKTLVSDIFADSELDRTAPIEEGGAGSGNFDHAGRPGEVGGSGEGGGAPASEWKPSMKKGKAEEWAKDSVVKEYQYHNTNSEAAEKIIEKGFVFDEWMGCYGAGVYMAEGQPETGYGEHALELQVNVKHVFDWSTGGDFKGDHYPTDIAAVLWYRDTYHISTHPTAKMVSAYVQHLGFDAIRVEGSDPKQRWLVVLDAKNITVVSHGHKIKYQKAESLQEGGEGSGNWGHSGRPGEVGGSAADGGVVAFHGTSADSLKNILKNGIVPVNKHNWGKSLYTGDRASAVYVTKSLDMAKQWASKSRVGKHADAMMAMLVLRIPKSFSLKPDTKATKDDFYTSRTIKPEWIKGVLVSNRLDPKTFADVWEHIDINKLMGEAEEEFEEFFLPFLIIKGEVLEKGTAKSGNFGHAGRPGKIGGSKPATGGESSDVGPKGTQITTGQVNVDDLPAEYAKTWANWKQDNNEKMLFITKDGRMVIIGSGEKSQVGLSLKDIDGVLKGKEIKWSDLKVVVHNHDKGEAPSQTDMKVFRAMMAAGFGGESQIYTPSTGAIRTVPYSGGESLRSKMLRIKAINEVSRAAHILANDDEALGELVDEFLSFDEGGSGSGNFDHAGRPGEVGGSAFSKMVLFHGTTLQNAQSIILRDGLVPQKGLGADAGAIGLATYADKSLGFVYLTKDLDRASTYATYAAKANPGTQPVVIEIRITKEYANKLEKDPQSSDLRLKGKIPAEAIKGVKLYDKPVTYRKIGDPTGRTHTRFEKQIEDEYVVIYLGLALRAEQKGV